MYYPHLFTSREAGLEESSAEVEVEHNIQDEFKRLTPVWASSKVKAFDCYADQTGTAKVMYKYGIFTSDIFFWAFYARCLFAF